MIFENYFNYIARYSKNTMKNEEKSIIPVKVLSLYNNNVECNNLLIFSETEESDAQFVKKRGDEEMKIANVSKKTSSLNNIKNINKILKESEKNEPILKLKRCKFRFICS